nr:reverse transcriptase domain-containing protein [Tanacetum cinerariifolium]
MYVDLRIHARVNNSELKKRLNQHVPKTMEEMMITTTAFIRGEAAAANKKKSHTSWRTQDQSKRQTSEKRSDFQGHPREGRGSSRFTPLQGNQKKLLRPKQVQPPPPMVTPVKKRSNNKFCAFHNDRGHNTDECMQLKKQIEELVQVGKLSHLIKEIKHGRDQSKVGKKETPAKDKPAAIYMIQSWQRMTRQKVTQSFERVREITFPPLTTSSLMEILYEHCFNRLRPEVKNQMVLATTSLNGFSGETIWPLRQPRLLVTIGDADHSTRAWMNFMIVRSLSLYNGIIGRHGIKEIQAVPSTAHGMLKFLVDGGIVTIRSTILIPAECATMITSSAVPKEEGYSPVRQKKRGQAPERAKAIQAEVQKFKQGLSAGLLSSSRNRLESQISLRLSFQVFLDAYKGYHQIQLAELDEEKTAFHTGQKVCCYTKMPFGLKNAGATYQRLVGKAFDSQIGRNIEVYVENLVVKSHTEAEMLRDIGETFCTLQKINMKLNPKKCTFGAVERVFLRYMVTPEGRRLCPDKTMAKSEAKQAFKQLKQNLSKLPLLVAPKPKEELIVYLSASYGAISAVLMTERGAVQTLVYFVSCALQGPELNYNPMKKLVLPLFFATERLQRTTTKIECHAGRTQYHVPAKDVGERTASNNEAKYEALIAGLWIAAQMGMQNVHVSVDSKLVANQVLGTYVTKEENMIKYLQKVKSLVSGFTNFSISQVPRSKNKKADAMSKNAATSFAHLSKQVLVKILKEKSVQEKEVTTVVEEDGPTWMTPIMEYLKEWTLFSDRKEAKKLRIKARQNPQHLLTPITAPWPFYKWRIDIVGPFPEGPGKVKFIIVSMDYFMKWIEAKAMVTITGSQVKKFVWDNIVCRFGLPREIVSANGKQFNDNPFKDWCDKLNITHQFASVKHPQSNGLVERVNRSLGKESRPALARETRISVTFKPCDFVYHSNDASHAVDGGKLGPKWEGPYKLTKALGDGAYKLRSTNETVLPRTWNIANLKRCYL